MIKNRGFSGLVFGSFLVQRGGGGIVSFLGGCIGDQLGGLRAYMISPAVAITTAASIAAIAT